jgi:hypothetical protein
MMKSRSICLACVVTLAISSLAWSEQMTFKVKHQLRSSPDSTRRSSLNKPHIGAAAGGAICLAAWVWAR